MSTDPRAALAAIWDEHVNSEFGLRDADAALASMVEDAYVNHVPVMSGGQGRSQLHDFYANHFIAQMPPDITMQPISRTIGEDRIVDEMVAEFTHSIEMDWMLPGVKPTGRRVSIPLVVVVSFRDGKLAHEHIYWDQASVLVQVGLLDRERLPVTGREAADKVKDPRLPANSLMTRSSRG
jgi:carboxymethylenebutenolidase